MKKTSSLEGPIEKGTLSVRTNRKKHPLFQIIQLGKQKDECHLHPHWLGVLVQDTRAVAQRPHQGLGAAPSQACSYLSFPLQKEMRDAENERPPCVDSLGFSIRLT